jgi:nucleoside-diphosphate-sugar epimerase
VRRNSSVLCDCLVASRPPDRVWRLSGDMKVLVLAGDGYLGYIDIRDTMRCVELATANLPERGEYRVIKQITEQLQLGEITNGLASVAKTSVRNNSVRSGA